MLGEKYLAVWIVGENGTWCHLLKAVNCQNSVQKEMLNVHEECEAYFVPSGEKSVL